MRVDAETDLTAHIDSVPRDLVAVSFIGRIETWEKSHKHHHRKAQLLCAMRGTINCEVDNGIWIVPPKCAIWIPGGLPHIAFGSGEVECSCIFVAPKAAAKLPLECCMVTMSNLLHQLVLRAADLPDDYAVEGHDGRLASVLLDELASSPTESLQLPIPPDRRLRKLAALLLADPANRSTLAEWALRIGLSERSLSRMFIEEIGMSFGSWRRQLHVILALHRLTAGESVQTVALDLGYESASSFVTMFRKLLGKPPGRYLLDRQEQA